MFAFGNNDCVKIDDAHTDLIYALVGSAKPQHVLEFGIGGAAATDAILHALIVNESNYSYTLVDNWVDFGGIIPQDVIDRYGSIVNLVSSDEKDFVFSTKETYDFILSDADHCHTNEWFEYVYDTLLMDGGILIYHDINFVDNEFPNLREIYYISQRRGLIGMLFNRNSRPDERCQRGLFIIKKG